MSHFIVGENKYTKHDYARFIADNDSNGIMFHDFTKNPEYTAAVIDKILKHSESITALSNNLSERDLIDINLLSSFLIRKRPLELLLMPGFDNQNSIVYQKLKQYYVSKEFRPYITVRALGNDLEIDPFIVGDMNKYITRYDNNDGSKGSNFSFNHTQRVADILHCFHKEDLGIRKNILLIS